MYKSIKFSNTTFNGSVFYMLVFLIVLAIVIALMIFLMFFMVKLKVNFVLNAESKSGYFSVNFLKITLVQGKVYLLEDYSFSVVADMKMHFEKQVPKLKDKLFSKEILSRIVFEDIILYVNGGKEDDAFLTAMTIGAVYAFFESLINVSDKIRGSAKIAIIPNYQKDALNISTQFKIRIRLSQVLMALFQSRKQFRAIHKLKIANEKTKN